MSFVGAIDTSALLGVSVGLNFGYAFIRALSDHEISSRTATAKDLHQIASHKFKASGADTWSDCQQEYWNVLLAISVVESDVHWMSRRAIVACIILGVISIILLFDVAFGPNNFSNSTRLLLTIFLISAPLSCALSLWLYSLKKLSEADKHIRALRKYALE